jgi:isoleucyl-tRNA synthetase
MYDITEALVRWMAPILSFTAEEIWQHMPGERADSVFLSEWYAGLDGHETLALDIDYWQQVISIRDAVSKELENARNQKVIGSGLAAEVDLYCEPDLAEVLGRLGDELRFVMITSYIRIHPLEEKPEHALAAEGVKNLYLVVSASGHEKCDRCWHYREDVGSIKGHETICGRCLQNIEGSGEVRLHA